MAIRTSARPRGVGVVLTTVCALLVAGCSDSGEGTATPSTSAGSSTTVAATPTASETPTVTETSPLPPLPEAAKQNTPEGAEAFIRYYFDVANGLYVQPVAGLVPTISHADCVACQRTETTISEFAATNSRARVEPFAIQSMSRLGGGPPGVQRFDMVADAPANATVDAQGGESNLGDATTVAGIGAAYWDGERWTLYGLELAPQ